MPVTTSQGTQNYSIVMLLANWGEYERIIKMLAEEQ